MNVVSRRFVWLRSTFSISTILIPALYRSAPAKFAPESQAYVRACSKANMLICMPFRLAPRRSAPICRPDRAGMTRMAWTAEDRRRYAPAIREVLRQGMMVRLVRTMDTLDPQPKVGRERVWSTLIMLQASWHLARDGCAWRRLPAGFPPFTTVWSRLRRWRELAVLDRALAILVACLRLARGRKRRPTAAIIDTQSVKTGPQRGPRGYDAGKKVKGRKRVLLVDSEGDPLGLRVVPADVHEHRALRALVPVFALHPTQGLAWLGRGLAGDEPEAFLNGRAIAAEVVGIRNRAGFQLEKRRWKVEQTFGCLQRYRRLRVDDEAGTDPSRHMTVLASVFMTGMRFERMLQA